MTTLFKRQELTNQADGKFTALYEDIRRMLEEEQKLTPKQIEKARQNLEKLNDTMIQMLRFLAAEGPKKKKEIFNHVGMTTQTFNTNQYLVPMLELGLIQPTIKDRPTSIFHHAVRKKCPENYGLIAGMPNQKCLGEVPLRCIGWKHSGERIFLKGYISGTTVAEV